MPPRANNSSCVPRSAARPSSITITSDDEHKRKLKFCAKKKKKLFLTVGLFHCWQTMSYDEHCFASFQQILQRFFDQMFCLGIQRARRLIEQQNRRLLQHRASNRNALTLSARQFNAALAHNGVIAVFERFNKFVRICLVCFEIKFRIFFFFCFAMNVPLSQQLWFQRQIRQIQRRTRCSRQWSWQTTSVLATRWQCVVAPTARRAVPNHIRPPRSCLSAADKSPTTDSHRYYGIDIQIDFFHWFFKRKKKVSYLFPPPDGPTNATTLPGSNFNDNSCKTNY